MSNKNEVFECLIDQLRQQLTNNPYKQQCEHDWYFYNKGASMMCKKCGLKK